VNEEEADNQRDGIGQEYNGTYYKQLIMKNLVQTSLSKLEKLSLIYRIKFILYKVGNNSYYRLSVQTQSHISWTLNWTWLNWTLATLLSQIYWNSGCVKFVNWIPMWINFNPLWEMFTLNLSFSSQKVSSISISMHFKNNHTTDQI